MSPEMWSMAAVSATTTLLAVGLLALAPRLLRRFSARVRAALWMLLLLRLALPFQLPLPAGPAAMTVEVPRPLWEEPAWIAADGGNTAAENIAGGPAQSRLPVMVWAAGAAAYLLVHGAAYARFSRNMRRGARPAEKPIREAMRRLTGDKGPSVWRTDTASPVLVGAFRSRLYLPEGELPEPLELMLLHEAQHWRRRDILKKQAALLLGAVLWFHPAAYALIRRFCREVELGCDEAAAAGMGEAQRLRYGEMLLRAAVPGRPPLLSAGLGSRRSFLRVRLESLLDGKRKKRGGLLVACLALLLAASGGLVAFTAAAAPAVLPLPPAALKAAAPARPDFQWPSETCTRIVNAYGMRWGALHTGIDLIPPDYTAQGQAVAASADGVVAQAVSGHWNGGYGRYVILDHGGGWQTLYAHCDTVRVRPGQRVKAGEIIAEAGQTGHATGPHLHFEIRRDGEAVDPADWLPE